jgi:hypothetical protein
VSDDVQQVSAPGSEEAWERLTDDPDVRGIETARVDEIGGWQVTVWAMEFVRHDPLETDMRRRMATALRAVNGVATADEQDREVWFVTGTPSGKELTEPQHGLSMNWPAKSAPPCVAYKGATRTRASPVRSRSGMCARYRNTMACINMLATLAIVPWTPVMAGTLTT